mmetsp:Transcript_20231/g.49626  ORF Transcript_20231/g.49626 Transcript_20231/m.49626 type:complete len:446 (-) Transcript_20231:165-1502(-)
MKMTKAYLTIQAGNAQPERLDLILYRESVPRTVANFCHYLREAAAGKGYRNSSFHRIIKGFMAQGGDFLNSDGTGSTSIYGKTFEDENFLHRHDKVGVLSMANSGKNTNGSQFFITFRPVPHLDGKHVVFGHVDLSTPESRATLERLESVRTVGDDKPHSPVRIVDCGVDEDEEPDNTAEEEEQVKDTASAKTTETVPEEEEDANELELPESEDEEPPKTKAEAIKRRMRKLKLKMNQARQLNKQEVLKEGERLTSLEGAAAVRKRQMIKDKKMNQADWKAKNSKAFGVAEAHGIDGKHLVQQADSSLKAAFKKKAKAKANRFEMQDYYNSEGQHRNYERNLKSLHRAAVPLDESHTNSTDTFNPMSIATNASDEAREREGARNLANEMKRRVEKQKKKRERMEFEETDVSYINNRNKRFNQKISRNFDKHTAEIRQNLERGTAL